MNSLPLSPSESRGFFALLAPYAQVALAVSGGPDSLALMLLAMRWREECADGPKLSVLTVDHGLRAGARAEAEGVGRMASALGLDHAILTWEKAEAPAANLQERARVARYDLMAAFCHARGIPALVTAHTQDDQAETVLMRLKRGSGLDGLAAIPERGAWAGITILRPLLDVPKARLVATLDAAGLAYVTDPSNADPRFERARLRARSSALEAFGLTPEALALSARRLRRAREALDEAARDFLARHGAVSAAGYATVDRAALAAAPQEIALRALAQTIAAVGGGEAPVQLAKLETLLAALGAHPDKAHTLGRCRLENVSGRLGVFREVRGEGLPVARVSPGERALWDNRFTVELGAGANEAVIVKALGDEGFRALRERSEAISALPRLAARTLPCCWRGEALLGLPQLRLPGTPPPFVPLCRAHFVSEAGRDVRRR
ncbi:MAG: tRNA lysidine(34) synthetase TilS [Methyloceanibacter sp.]